MPELRHDGASIHYEVTGEGPAIVLGHSLLCDTDMWRGVVPRLAARHKVINVEVRGHRRSTAPGPFTLEDLAGDWLAILDEEGIDRAWLCGLSMGAMTAMRLALRAPERVRGLVLLDTSAGPEDRSRRIQYAAMIALYRRLGLVGALRKRTGALMLGRSALGRQPELGDWLHACIARHRRDELVRAMHAVFGRRDLSDRLGELATPTLVLVGAEDAATPVAKATRLRDGIPGARLEVLDRLGHLSALEDPEMVAGRILAFVDEHRE